MYLDIYKCKYDIGWFLTIPNKNLYEKMYEKALNRTMYPWSEKQGWGTPMPSGVYYRGGKINIVYAHHLE
jgi:hypothetical protein